MYCVINLSIHINLLDYTTISAVLFFGENKTLDNEGKNKN